MSQASTYPVLLQNSMASSTAMIRSTRALSRRSRSKQQIRCLRIGLWSSYLDPEFQKEVQRRHRIMKHKYMEAVNRKLSWDRHNSIPSRHHGLKSFMCSAWSGQDTRPGGRWIDMDSLQKSRGIEEVEQSALDKLLDSKDELYRRVRARSQVWLANANNAINSGISSTASSKDTPRRAAYGDDDFQKRFQRFQTQNKLELEYEIDPITNRKVFKNKTSGDLRKPIDVPVKTFKGYRSQFQDFIPPSSQMIESQISTQDRLQIHDKRADHGPVVYRGPDGKVAEEPDAVRESLKEYEKHHPIGAVLYHEPDGKLPEKPDSVRESLKAYEEKYPNDTVRYTEPVGNLSEKHDPIQEGLKDYDSRVTYGPVMHNEPDGKPPPRRDSVAEALRDYDERAEYGPGRVLKNITLNPGSRIVDQSFRYSNEDLDLLRPSDVRAASGIIKGEKKETDAEKLAIRSKLEKAFQKQQDLHVSTCEDISSNKPTKSSQDLATRHQLLDLKIENSELQNVQAHLRGRVNAELAKVSAESSPKEANRKMTGNYVRDFPEEFETKWTSVKGSGSLKPHKELVSENVEPASSSSFARNPNTPRIQTSLDRTSKASRSFDETRLQNERDPYSKVPQGLETSYANEKAEEIRLQNEQDPYSKKPMGLETNYANEVAEELKLQNERDPYSKEPQGLETNYANEKAETMRLENERDPYSKKPMGLETSYAEEVFQKRVLEIEKDPYSKVSQGLETSYAEEVASSQAEGDLCARVASFGKRNDAEIDKRTRQLAKQERKNRMKQMDKNLVQEIRNIYEENYGILDSKHRQIPEPMATKNVSPSNETASATENPEPTLYKILAYDPTMQEINTASTTSIVPDTSTALTPAEVLLRLSNPAKFFPHFAPLQSQGYEIISGSGDVLVFRKVRPASPPKPSYKTNPIDGMQVQATTGNFASPTGFVNHDLPQPVSAIEADVPFKSNIDVRREEPVFSGGSKWGNENERKRNGRGRGKRLLIGAAWVAGCSYAIGVVAEFFRTGGVDGRGVQGF